MNKQNYEHAELEIIYFKTADVITTSTDNTIPTESDETERIR